MNMTLRAMAARNLVPGRYFIEFEPMPSQVGPPTGEKQPMIFTSFSATATFTPPGGRKELIRLVPYDEKAFLQRLVNADELIPFQEY